MKASLNRVQPTIVEFKDLKPGDICEVVDISLPLDESELIVGGDNIMIGMLFIRTINPPLSKGHDIELDTLASLNGDGALWSGSMNFAKFRLLIDGEILTISK